MAKKNNLLGIFLLLAVALSAAELTPVDRRLTDESHRADRSKFKEIADRIAALPAESSARAVASAWLLVAQSEYDRADRTAFAASALTRAESALLPDATPETALSVYREWIAHRRATAGFRAALPLLPFAEALEGFAPARVAPPSPDARPAHLPASLHAFQTRLAALWDAGLSAESYAFAQAQHWLDFTVDAYYARDRSGLVAASAATVDELLRALEQSSAPPALPAARRLRDDLWAVADRSRPADLGSRLTAREPRLAALARLEVQLRWAGHEHHDLGWRAARPLVRLAERYAVAAAPTAP